MCSVLEKPVTVHKFNQGAITLAVSPQMQPHTKHIWNKYNCFWSFVANGDAKIEYVDTKEETVVIFKKTLDSELFGYLRYKFNGF